MPMHGPAEVTPTPVSDPLPGAAGEGGRASATGRGGARARGSDGADDVRARGPAGPAGGGALRGLLRRRAGGLRAAALRGAPGGAARAQARALRARRAPSARAGRGGARGQLRDLGGPPGVKREDVQLEVGHDGVLKLSVSQAAEKKVRFEGEEGNPPPPDEGRAEEPREGEAGPEEQPQQPAIKWRRVERARRFESRAVQLPPDANAAAVSAALADGVLRLSVPKKAEPASRRIEVQ